MQGNGTAVSPWGASREGERKCRGRCRTLGGEGNSSASNAASSSFGDDFFEARRRAGRVAGRVLQSRSTGAWNGFSGVGGMIAFVTWREGGRESLGRLAVVGARPAAPQRGNAAGMVKGAAPLTSDRAVECGLLADVATSATASAAGCFPLSEDSDDEPRTRFFLVEAQSDC